MGVYQVGSPSSSMPSRAARIRAMIPADAPELSPAGSLTVQLHRRLSAQANRLGGEAQLEQLGDDELGGFGKILKNVGKAVGKGVKDVGHGVGAVATSKIGQLATAGVLAATGVGLPAAALIGAGVQGGGNLVKKGGNLKKAGKGAAAGAAEGAAGSLLGKGARKVFGKSAPKLGPGPSTRALPTGALVDLAPGMAMVQPIASPLTAAPDLTVHPTNVATAPAAMTEAEADLHKVVTGAKLASKAHDAGQAAKKQSKSLGDRAGRLSGNAASLAKKAQAAADAGDAIGASGLAEQARNVAAIATNTQNAADQAADYASRAGNAIAAGTDAAIAAAATDSEGAGDLLAKIQAHPVASAAIGAGVAFLAWKAFSGGSSRSSRRAVA